MQRARRGAVSVCPRRNRSPRANYRSLYLAQRHCPSPDAPFCGFQKGSISKSISYDRLILFPSRSHPPYVPRYPAENDRISPRPILRLHPRVIAFRRGRFRSLSLRLRLQPRVIEFRSWKGTGKSGTPGGRPPRSLRARTCMSDFVGCSDSQRVKEVQIVECANRQPRWVVIDTLLELRSLLVGIR